MVVHLRRVRVSCGPLSQILTLSWRESNESRCPIIVPIITTFEVASGVEYLLKSWVCLSDISLALNVLFLVGSQMQMPTRSLQPYQTVFLKLTCSILFDFSGFTIRIHPHAICIQMPPRQKVLPQMGSININHQHVICKDALCC